MTDDEVLALLGDRGARLLDALMYLAKHDRRAYLAVQAQLRQLISARAQVPA